MKKLFTFLKLGISALLLCLTTNVVAQTISQKPLLSVSSTAKPNLLFMLDNSGSMNLNFVPDNFLSSFEFPSPTTATMNPVAAYRSSFANKLFYDPTIRYLPRVDYSGTQLENATEASALAYTKFWSGSAAANGIFYTDFNNSKPLCGGGLCQYFTISANPNEVRYEGTYSNDLVYHLCTSVNAANKCTSTAQYTVPQNSATYTLTAQIDKPATRTDCKADPTKCTWQEERQNALNWQQYYSSRLTATQTAAGQAFADARYDNAFRLGYGRMNKPAVVTQDNTGSITFVTSFPRTVDDSATVTGVANTSLIRRAVRPFTNNEALATGFKTEKTDFFTWLYGQTGGGGTPTKQLLEASGNYFGNTTTTGPWSASPAIGSTEAQLSCRRNNTIVFSDGAYNNTEVSPVPAELRNVDNGDFTNLANTTHTDSKSVTFVYSTTPSKTATYITYPDAATNTLADMAAKFWIQDLRPDLPDTLNPVSGNPAYWQHMVTYSIGYGIRGSVTDAQIARYNQDYLLGITPTALAWGAPNTNINIINDFVHAGYSGRGKSYSVVTANQVKNAFNDILSRTTQQAGSDAGVAVADTNSSLSTLAGEFKYVPSYSILESSGDVAAFVLSANGDVSSTTPAWLASRNIPGFATRTLVTMSGTNVPTDLTGTFAALPGDVKTALGPQANDAFIEYLRGKATGIDTSTNEIYRLRASLMGTIVNSPPAYIRGSLNMGYTTTLVTSSATVPGISKYSAFRTAKTNNSLGILLAPSNDGIVHAINPRTGEEVMGYMPRAAMSKLQNFGASDYTHKYIVDGPVNEGDIYDGSNWKSVAIGTGGRGGQYVYAMSIPTLATATAPLTAPAMDKNSLLWEVNNTTAGFNNLGYVLNQPQTGFLPDGTWVAVFGNGYNSATGEASLFVVNALTGEFIQEISTNQGSLSKPNALGGVTLVRGKNRQVVAAIAGDRLGNMWKFDLRVRGSGDIAFKDKKPLFTSLDKRPFTAAPAWRPLNNGMLVVAATGELVADTDAADLATNTIYGVLDKTPIGGDEDEKEFEAPADMSKLQLQTSTAVVSTATNAFSFYTVSRNLVDYTKQSGWRLDMTYEAGQRSIADVLNFGQTVVVATVVPPVVSNAESCPAGNSAPGYIYQIDAETGGNADIGLRSSGKGSGFDVNGDGIGDGYSVAKSSGFPRGSVVAQDQVGPRTESVLNDTSGTPCDGSSTSGFLIGTGASALGLISSCGGGFLRTWRQLLNPPVIR
jgi:type IV pilus assembly protein PilY1